MEPIQIIIADDHQMFTEGLISLLSSEPSLQVVGSAANGVELMEKLAHTPAHLVLMDINMPEMNGLEATKAMAEQFPDTKVLMLTMMNDPKLIEQLISAGAHGYILKNTGKEELLKAIQTIISGSNYYSQEVTNSFMESFRKKKTKPTAKSAAIPVQLTRREKEVLKLIVQELTASEIADKLFISQNTVDTHRKNLLSKLDVRNTAGLVKYALQNGLAE